DARLQVCANINVVTFLMVGIVLYFELLPLVFLIVPFTTALFNVGFVIIFLRDLNQHRDLSNNYKRQRNRYIRMIILDVAWMTLITVTFVLD
ncbi:MAG: hypothetical protein NTV01_06290, partial [Bacteroidia bacterium]|nr:hypothetical protein [Bacteroidia bacterium]